MPYGRRYQSVVLGSVLVSVLGLGARPAAAADAPAREGPGVRTAKEAAVGVMAADLSFRDLAGTGRRLSGFRGRKAVVVCMTGTACPLAKRYLPALAELERSYRDRGVAFVLVNPQRTESVEAMRRAAADAGFAGVYAHDPDRALAAALGATSTTEAFVLDAARTVVYRGAVDDQFGLGYALDRPRRRFLADALDAVLAGRPPEVAATTAPGCALDAGAPPSAGAAAPAVTYHNRVSRIVQRSCQECHRAGEPGPFPLGTYAEVADRLAMVRKVVRNGSMPPWHADPAVGRFANDTSLSDRDRADLLGWAAAGAPEGDPADAPLPRAFVDGWRIGRPDAVFEAAAPQAVPARGPIKYRYVVIETNLDRDRWVRAAEVRVGQPQVVHHLLVFVMFPKGDPRARNYPDFRGGLGGYFVGLVPGQADTAFPAGTAKLLPKGAKLVLQVHYTPDGTSVEDRPRVGFRFADGPPAHEVMTVAAHNEWFAIPAGADNHRVSADYRFRGPTRILSFNPHSHVRGKAWRYELVYPDGRAATVLDVPRYDFNWQLEYRLAEPVDVPAGTVLRATAWYDNGEANPANPDPAATVRFGEQTHEEMMIGYVTGHRLPPP